MHRIARQYIVPDIVFGTNVDMGTGPMTTSGGSEDAASETPHVLKFGADDPEAASYRQDDAPHGDDSTPPIIEPDDGSGIGEPDRAIDQILAALGATPLEFARLIEGQSEEALAKPASDGEWGVVEILPHLRDWEEVYLGWIRHLLDEETPVLEAVDDSLWAIEHDYANEHVPEALASFTSDREEVVQLLESLDEPAWQREAVHPQLGRITLHQLADRMCDHDARHMEQARDALS